MNVKTTEIAQATTKSAWGLMKSQVRHGARSLIATFIRYPWAGTKSSSINASYWCSPWISFEFEKIKRKTSSRLSTPTLCFFITQTVPVCYVEPAKFFKSRTQFISNRRSCRWSLSWSAIFVSFWVLFLRSRYGAASTIGHESYSTITRKCGKQKIFKNSTQQWEWCLFSSHSLRFLQQFFASSRTIRRFNWTSQHRTRCRLLDMLIWLSGWTMKVPH